MSTIGPLHDPVTWYKIIYTGEQVAQWDFQNKGRCIVLEVPLCNLLTSIYNFVPCDRVVQRAYWDHLCNWLGECLVKRIGEGCNYLHGNVEDLYLMVHLNFDLWDAKRILLIYGWNGNVFWTRKPFKGLLPFCKCAKFEMTSNQGRQVT